MERSQVTLAQSQSQSEKWVKFDDALYTLKISIALLIQSLDLLWSAEIGRITILLTLHRIYYRTKISIAHPIQSLDLFVRLVLWSADAGRDRVLLTSNTISIYWRCINNVNQVSPKRGKGISIALGSLSRALFACLIYSLV